MSRTKATEPRVTKALDGLRLGMTRRAAFGAAGISKSTLYRMLEADDGTLRDAIEKAEQEAEAMYLARVALAADDPKNWTAAAWWLERRYPHDFGRRDRVEMTVDVRGAIDKLTDDPAEREAAMREVDRILAESR